jgi:hypothetical protein
MLLRQCQSPSEYVPRRPSQRPHRLKRQENKHAATSTQKIS